MIDKQRGFDKAKYDTEIGKLRADNNDLQHENKILKENYNQGGEASVEHKQLVQELASLENHNKYLQDENKSKDREKNNLHNEVNRLKAQIREMEKLYDSELNQQKDKVRLGNSRINKCLSRFTKERPRQPRCLMK